MERNASTDAFSAVASSIGGKRQCLLELERTAAFEGGLGRFPEDRLDPGPRLAVHGRVERLLGRPGYAAQRVGGTEEQRARLAVAEPQAGRRLRLEDLADDVAAERARSQGRVAHRGQSRLRLALEVRRQPEV